MWHWCMARSGLTGPQSHASLQCTQDLQLSVHQFLDVIINLVQLLCNDIRKNNRNSCNKIKWKISTHEESFIIDQNMFLWINNISLYFTFLANFSLFILTMYLPLVSRPNDIDAKARLGTISSSVGDDGISGELSVQVPIIAPWMDSSHLSPNKYINHHNSQQHHDITNRFFSFGDSAVNS